MRLKLFILSAMFLTLTSGILFYISLGKINPVENITRINLHEINQLNVGVYQNLVALKQDPYLDLNELNIKKGRLQDINILLPIDFIQDEKLKTQISLIKNHLNEKRTLIDTFETNLKRLREDIIKINSLHKDLEQKKLTKIIDGKDFFKDCLIDIYRFLAFPTKFNEEYLMEDVKILKQITMFQSTKAPEFLEFQETFMNLHVAIKAVNQLVDNSYDKKILESIRSLESYQLEKAQEESNQHKNILAFALVTFILYLIFVLGITNRR